MSYDPLREAVEHHRRMQRCAVCDDEVTTILRGTGVNLCHEHAWKVAGRFRGAIEAQLILRETKKASEAERRELVAQGNGEGSLVYYVRIGDYIKIGYSARLKNRFRSLRADELLAIEPGALDVERERHAQFKADRIDLRRENFRPSPALMAHIDATHKRYGLPYWATLPTTSVVTTRRKESA